MLVVLLLLLLLNELKFYSFPAVKVGRSFNRISNITVTMID